MSTDKEVRRLVSHVRHRRLGDGRRIETVGIEAGHIYTGEVTGQEHLTSFRIGADLFGAMVGFARVRPTAIVFIDNYNPGNGQALCLRNHLGAARDAGFFQESIELEGEVIMEADMIPGAESIIQMLVADGQTYDCDGGLYARKHNVCLRKPDGKLSCSLLDAAFCLKRFECWDFNITILPSDSSRHYRDQQRGVRRILRLLGCKDIPLANVYFQTNGQFVISWS